MKKRIFMFLALLTVYMLSIMCFAEEEHEILESGNYEYYVNDDGTVTISDCWVKDEEIEIPSELDGRLVTGIERRAFSNCAELMSVTLPASLTTIDSNPFLDCKVLAQIKVSPDNEVFNAIDNVLFNKKEKTLVCYPRGLSENEYSIPEGTQTIGKEAFKGCSELVNVEIPALVTMIGDCAFYECTSLTSIDIPDSVTTIGDNPFGYCHVLNKIKVSPDHEVFAVIDNALINMEENSIVSYPCGLSESKYRIPEEIQIIGAGAFAGCEGLKSIEIPDSVTTIEMSAFANCTNLMNIEIPDSVTIIGNSAFIFCSSMTSIEIPDSVTTFGDYMFVHSEALTKVKLSEKMTTIGEYTFMNCSGLTNIEIPDSVTTIEYAAFCYCTSLTSIEIPSSVTTIGETAFGGCDKLTLVVGRDSYAAQYAEENGIPYTYPDAND